MLPSNDRALPATLLFALTCVCGCGEEAPSDTADRPDGGPRPDHGVVCEGEVPRRLEPLCEDGAGIGCDCALGTPEAFSTLDRGYGQSTLMLGPTTSGGFVAAHARGCVEDCDTNRRAVLEVFRFDPSGQLLAEPLEVTSSLKPSTVDAVLEGDILSIAYGDEAGGSTESIHLAALDVETGRWLTEPRAVLDPPGALISVALARGSGGYGVVFSQTVSRDRPDATPGFLFASVDETGTDVTSPRLVADTWGRRVGIIDHGDGYLLGRWTEDGLELARLSSTGDVIDDPTPVSANRVGNSGPILQRTEEGHRVTFGNWDGLFMAHTDRDGRLTDALLPIADGALLDVVDDGDSTVVTWRMVNRCPHDIENPPLDWTGGTVLTRVDAGGARVHRDLLLRHDRETSASGAELVRSQAGLFIAYNVPLGPDGSTSWLRPACGSL